MHLFGQLLKLLCRLALFRFESYVTLQWRFYCVVCVIFKVVVSRIILPYNLVNWVQLEGVCRLDL